MTRLITLFTLALAACTDGFNFAPQQTLFSRSTASSGHRESVVAQISRTIETDGLAFTVEDIPHLKNWIPDLEMHDTPLGNAPDSMMKTRPDPSFFVNEDDLIAAQVAHTAQEARSPQAFHRAGARAKVAFEVGEAKAAIATCGGLCPGLNTVVRELYLCLSRQYGVKTVLGVRDGYAGFGRIDKAIELTEEYVADIQKQGGTVLRSSRGGHDTMVICDALEAQGINMLFLVGGDGTMKGAVKIEDEMRRRGKKCVVGVVPKTIDNDVPVIDMSFGFNTAVQEAASHINAAYTEAAGCPNGIGVVRLMGRHSGFIAMTATLASGDVDACLIPEADFQLEPIYDHLEQVLRRKEHALIIVAEGAGQSLMGAEGVKDASGNVINGDIGQFMKAKISEHFSGPQYQEDEHFKDRNAKCFYIDPTYKIRAVAANAADNVYCSSLAHAAVHGAMAGFSGFLVGNVNTRLAMLPLSMVVNRRNVVSVRDRMWTRLLFSTSQPPFAVTNDGTCDVELLYKTETASGGCTIAVESNDSSGWQR